MRVDHDVPTTQTIAETADTDTLVIRWRVEVSTVLRQCRRSRPDNFGWEIEKETEIKVILVRESLLNISQRFS